MKIYFVGNPNCGKTTIFNHLTGLNQKVANYPGITTERREGHLSLQDASVYLVDLPGVYSVDQPLAEEVIAAQEIKKIANSDAIVLLADPFNLLRSLQLVQQLPHPKLILAINFMDEFTALNGKLDPDYLRQALGGIPVVLLSGKTKIGLDQLKLQLQLLEKPWPLRNPPSEPVATIAKRAITQPPRKKIIDDRLDQVVLHPIFGWVFFLTSMFVIFQAVFSWAQPLMEYIDVGTQFLSAWTLQTIGDGPLGDILANAVIAGVGGVVIFLPQILILFFFIALLEDSGYLARAAFLVDRPFRAVGLSGKSFVPLLSSFACAIPGIMAARSIPDIATRLRTILVAPLMTCSARIPVYTLLIAAFCPYKPLGPFNLPGVVMFSLYALGLLGGLTVASLLKFVSKFSKQKVVPVGSLIIEMPTYRFPIIKSVAFVLWDRGRIFLKRAGTVLLGLAIALWILGRYPSTPLGESPHVQDSYLGKIGQSLAPAFAPLGFDWKVTIGILTSLAAREVFVGTLGTIYGLEANQDSNLPEDEQLSIQLAERLQRDVPLPTGIAIFVFFAFAMQCIATIAIVKRETNSWRWPTLQFFGFFFMAYSLAWIAKKVTEIWM